MSATAQAMELPAPVLTQTVNDPVGKRDVPSVLLDPQAIYKENVKAVVDDGYVTAAERTLITMGEQQRLRETRMLFQYAAEVDFRSAVEEATGRRVIAFLSAIDVVADVASEMFTLAPSGGTRSRSD